jgi:hypothetical protein
MYLPLGCATAFSKRRSFYENEKVDFEKKTHELQS